MGSERITFRLQPSDYDQLKRKAEDRGLSISDFMRQLIIDAEKDDEEAKNAEKMVDLQNALNYIQKQVEAMKKAEIIDPILTATLEMIQEELNELWSE